MRVIPVLDLMGGLAVHARRGERARYRPVQSVLAAGADPIRLASAFRNELGLSELYIADLDAIGGGPGHPLTLGALAGLGLSLMVDAGTSTPESVAQVLELGVDRAIVGTETLESLKDLASILVRYPGRVTVSLDMREGRVLSRSPQLAGQSPAAVAAELRALGAKEVIVLELTRVGSGAGPCWPQEVFAALGPLRWLAGGGVRHADDLRTLAQAGANGALVGTALHNGAIGATDMARLETKSERAKYVVGTRLSM